MTNYILVSTIILALTGIIWSRENALNLLVKVAFIAISVWGIVEYGIATGCVVRLP